MSRDCLELVQYFLAWLGPKTSLSESSDSTSLSRSLIVGVDFEELAPKKERISIGTDIHSRDLARNSQLTYEECEGYNSFLYYCSCNVLKIAVMF